MTTATAKQIRKNTKATLDSMIQAIKGEVQAFTGHLAAVTRDTTNLAPLVSAAFKRYKEENASATKLDFMKFFATKEQLASWPESDNAAKAPGSLTQSLFNGVEYLFRRAGQLERIAMLEAARDQIIAAAEVQAKIAAKEQGLKGEEFDAFVQASKEAALTGGGTTHRVTQDEIAGMIWNGWYSNLDDYDVFEKFVGDLLGLKYSANTVTSVLERAAGKIMETQQALTAQAPPVETPAAPPAPAVHVPAAHIPVPQRPTIPFRQHKVA